MYLSDMIELVLKKEPCIKKLYALRNVDYASPPKVIFEVTQIVEENHITHKRHLINRWSSSSPPECKFTPLIDTTDNFVNALLNEELIALPPIVEPKFTNDVPKKFYYE